MKQVVLFGPSQSSALMSETVDQPGAESLWWLLFGVGMYSVNVDLDKCHGCGDCVDSCPIQILAIVEDNGHKFVAFAADPEGCLGCYACEESCSEEAITMVMLEETGLMVQMPV